MTIKELWQTMPTEEKLMGALSLVCFPLIFWAIAVMLP